MPPPWGADRANMDFPSYPEVAQMRRNYHQVLDHQAQMQREKEKRRIEEDTNLERATLTSLDTQPPFAEQELKALTARRERAIYNELVGVATRRQESERKTKDAAREDYKRWAAEAELEFANNWHVKREQDRKERMSLAAVWKTAADERKTREEKERQEALCAERESLQRLVRGMVPHRRQKRSKAECLKGEPCPGAAMITLL